MLYFTSSETQKHLKHTNMNTSMVTIENVSKMKCHIYRVAKKGYNVEQIYMNIEMAMAHFDYQTEEIETVVFSHLSEMLMQDLERLEKSIA